MLVGIGIGTAVETAIALVPHFCKKLIWSPSFRCANWLCCYAAPVDRAPLTVRYAPITDPAVATAAYSYHGLRWLAARIAVKMSGPPNVGSGELSRMARKKRPNAPKWRNIEVTPWPRRGVAPWKKMFNTNPLYQLRWTAF